MPVPTPAVSGTWSIVDPLPGVDWLRCRWKMRLLAPMGCRPVQGLRRTSHTSHYAQCRHYVRVIMMPWRSEGANVARKHCSRRIMGRHRLGNCALVSILSVCCKWTIIHSKKAGMSLMEIRTLRVRRGRDLRSMGTKRAETDGIWAERGHRGHESESGRILMDSSVLQLSNQLLPSTREDVWVSQSQTLAERRVWT